MRCHLGSWEIQFGIHVKQCQRSNKGSAFGQCKWTRTRAMVIAVVSGSGSSWFPVALRTSLGLPSVCMLLVGLCFAMLCSILLVYRPRAPRSCIWHAHPLHNQRGRGPDGAFLRCWCPVSRRHSHCSRSALVSCFILYVGIGASTVVSTRTEFSQKFSWKKREGRTS